MNFEEFKTEFDALFARVSDDELVKAFADMGCEVEVVEPIQPAPTIQPATKWIPMLLDDGGVEWKAPAITLGTCDMVCSAGWWTDRSYGIEGYSERPVIEAGAVPSDRSAEIISAADSNRLALAA